MTKKKTRKTAKPAPAAKGKTAPKGKKKTQKKVIHARVTAPDPSTLHGFARLAVTDPDRLAQISAKAGRRAQKLYGDKVRWSARKARQMAAKGGAAIKRLWRTGKMTVATTQTPVKKTRPGRRHKAHKAHRPLPGTARPPLVIDNPDGVEINARQDPFQGPPNEAPGQTQPQPQPYEPLPTDPSNVEYQTPEEVRGEAFDEEASLPTTEEEIRDDVLADAARER